MNKAFPFFLFVYRFQLSKVLCSNICRKLEGKKATKKGKRQERDILHNCIDLYLHRNFVVVELITQSQKFILVVIVVFLR